MGISHAKDLFFRMKSPGVMGFSESLASMPVVSGCIRAFMLLGHDVCIGLMH